MHVPYSNLKITCFVSKFSKKSPAPESGTGLFRYGNGSAGQPAITERISAMIFSANASAAASSRLSL